ncbi:MAG: DUF2520 domain-containing protein [Thermoleophilaceae bacterium]
MRELERISADIPAAKPALAGAASDAAEPKLALAIVGAGRLGPSLATALRRAGHAVDGPLTRGEPTSRGVALLCVPDAEIQTAARPLREHGALLGHTSGATPLSALGDGESFGLHPLQTFTRAGGDPRGASCAIAGNSPRALAMARGLARSLGMRAFEIEDSARGSYHAAASIASNFLLALEDAAESVAESAGIDRATARRMFGPLVESTVRNWRELGPAAALSGPVARGDERTVAAQRGAVARARPELIPLWDALLERTRVLAAETGR